MKRKETFFRELARTFEEIEATSSNLKIIDILATFLPKLTPDEMRMTAHLLRGEIAPSYEALEFGVAQKMAIRAIAKAFDVSIDRVERLFAKSGDLGLVAESLGKDRKGRGLTIRQVFEELREIALTRGRGSQAGKLSRLSDLLSSSSALEAKYIVRTVLGVHRIGVAEMTFLNGLAKAFTGQKENKTALEAAYNVLPDLGEVAYRTAKGGLSALRNVGPVPGVPVRMMLAQRVEKLEEIKEHIASQVFAEYKYDGERAQIHLLRGGEIAFFSRRLEKITHQYPEIVQSVPKAFQGKEAIVEGEVVAYDPKEDRLHPFQVLMQRRRKYEIEAYAKTFPVTCFLFDILYVDGKNLLSTPLKNRRKLLRQRFKEVRPAIRFADYIVTEEMADIESYFHKVVKRGAEGIVVKSAEGVYQAGNRGWLWIKFKKEYEAELADTRDLVVVGALYGKGRRAGSYGSLLLAAFDPETNKYYSFTKVGAGFTDKDLQNLPKTFKPLMIPSKHRLVKTDMKMDVWFEPARVMEVAGAEITTSPVHSVARERIRKGGLALRFPRFLRWREDKTPEQATTVQEINQIYQGGRVQPKPLARTQQEAA
ncbi:MAG: ATP-dependent DNA ligase [Thermodesulfobacteriota bacterium]